MAGNPFRESDAVPSSLWPVALVVGTLAAVGLVALGVWLF